MASYGMLFNKSGVLIDEIDADFSRSYKKNAIGQCTFTFPTSHRKCTERNFQGSNYIVVLHDGGWPDWGGLMDHPRGWGSNALTINAVSAEYQFSIRAGVPFTYPERVFGTSGVIFENLINTANAEEDTLLRPGEIHKSGRVLATEIISVRTLDKNLAQLLKRSRHDYSITPQVVNNRLVFLANWHKRLGQTLDMSLNDRNCDLDENTLKEEGPIFNSIFAYAEDKLLFWLARDAESINKYRLRHKPLPVSAEDEVTVQWAAETELKKSAWPRKTFQANARNISTLTPFLRIGNILQYENAKVGFGPNGIGTQALVGIEGLACRDRETGEGMILKEVIL